MKIEDQYKPKYYNRDGSPMTMGDWAASFGEIGTKRVALTEIVCPSGEAAVSTVWLGLDHGMGTGPPLIFETLVMCACEEEYMVRYSTEAEAVAGHEKIVREHQTRQDFVKAVFDTWKELE